MRILAGPRTAASLLLIASLSGCVGLGGNIKGSFACQAPDGICAPSAVIDDRALAMISDDPSALPLPAAPYAQEPKPGSPTQARRQRIAVAQPMRGPVSADPGRTGEKVLRIVFPAYIDARGRFHEASAVHAVVSQGEWLSWSQDPAPARNAMAAAPEMPALADAPVGREAAPLEADPDLPDPSAVAAARARKADPVAAIKADVETRLKPPRSADTTTTASDTQSQASSSLAPSPGPVKRPTVRAAAFPATIAEDQ